MPDKDKIIIKDALEKDLDLMHELDIKNFKNPWSLNSLKDEFNHPNSYIKISVLRGRICGFIVYRIFLQETEIFKICSIKEKRRCGIGSLLLNFALKHSKKESFCIFLEVDEKNFEAISFYKKFGFISSGLRYNYYGQGNNALNMIKEFQGGLNGC